MPSSLFDCIYAAGLFDGEGCIMASSPAYKSRPICQVGMCDHQGVEFLHATWGGNLNIEATGNARHRALARWRVSGQDARKFIEDVRPFLRVKGAQADLALRLLEVKTGDGRVDIYNEIRALNRKGA